MNKSVSPSRTYVAMCSGANFVGYRFKKFVLPKKDLGLSGTENPRNLENDSSTAAWYYLNRLDEFSFIDGCISFEDFITVFSTEAFKANPLALLLEAQELLKNIRQDVINGQISDIAGDIEAFFDKYPEWESLNRVSLEDPE